MRHLPRLAAALLCLAVAACSGSDDRARAIARQTCDAVENADANPSQYMLQGLDDADAAGVPEPRFRDALVEECGMEPPARAVLERLNE